jgi:hypothetical protein
MHKGYDKLKHLHIKKLNALEVAQNRLNLEQAETLILFLDSLVIATASNTPKGQEFSWVQAHTGVPQGLGESACSAVRFLKG